LSSNTTGTHNVAVGMKAGLENTTGGSNVALGAEAMRLNTTGDNNTAVGKLALYANTTGTRNTAVGQDSLKATTTGSWNSSVGANSLEANTTGTYNVAVGDQSLLVNTTGLNNVAIGYNALAAHTTGQDNVCVGKRAGVAVTVNNKNTFIGNAAGNTTTTGQQNTVVGADCTPDASGVNNAIVIGYNVSGSGDTFSFGRLSNVVYNVFSSNASWTRSSDERKKTDIADATLGLDFVNDLRPVTFKWKRSQDIPDTLNDYDADVNHMDTDAVMHGMLAQDVKAALDTAGVTTFGGWVEEKDGSQSLSQEMFVHPLIKAIQELSAKNEALLTRIEALES
jgi:hypothetical protein